MLLFRFEKKQEKITFDWWKNCWQNKIFIKNELKNCNNHTLFLFITLKNLRSKLVNKLIQ